jgi:hypothetical protein
MKILKRIIKGLLILVLLLPTSIFSQNQEQVFVKVKTMHWNMNLADFSMQDWKALELDYFNKITIKNEHILSATVLQHHFTGDSSEILFITVFSSWNDIDLATQRTEELMEATWPNEDDRKAFLKKQAKFYAKAHSDEIYKSIPGTNRIEHTDLPLLYYVRTSYYTFPEDGSKEEFQSLLNEYNEVVTNNNEFYKGYYPQMHYYGSDRTEFLEVFCAETLAGLEKGIAKQGELFRGHWADEKAQDVYNDKYGRYLTGIHSDRIFSSVPDLYKPMPQD